MTAPDSRDSVERVVAEMRIPHEGGWDNDDVAALADRLQALARGPQQAGGEDPVQVAARIASEAACLRIDNERLQAEVARLTGANDALADALREANKGYVHELNRAETAEAALREAGRDAERGREIAAAFLPVMEAMRPLVLNLERLKDAALNGGQDDA